MSTTIDHRVVEMEFDNKQFERNVSTTMSSIDKLKQSLNFNGTSKGMSALSDAANNTGRRFDELETTACRAGFHLEDVWHKVSTVFEYQIANRIISAGKKMVSALTIDPVKTGFSEYETKIGAIQTILSNTANKGTTMDDVTQALGELNTYADKTIYNFAEMTRNIGRFTAAGVSLEDSTSAIQGIANLAAASGSTSQQASTAMYQLSQALSSGTLKLQDWNSVVNAGMGGEKFQEALKATAKDHGVAVDDMIKKYGSFRNSLQEGWITTDILNETLRKFTVEGAKEYAQSMVESGKYTKEQADALIKEAQAMEDAATKVKTFTQLWDTLKESAQSGWAQTWEILVGDFEEAKELLSKISDVVGGIIGKSAEARNELLENWKVMGGRDDLVQSFWNIFDAIGAIVKPIKEAFEEIFPPMTAEKLHAFTEGLKELTAKLKIGDKTADRLKRTFKGVFAIVDIFRIAIMAALKAVGSLFGGVGELGGGLLGFTASLGDLLVAFRDFIKYSDIFNTVFQGVATVIKFVVKIISTLINYIADGFATPVLEGFVNFLEDIGASMFTVEESAGSMKEAISSAFASMGEALQRSPVFRFFQSLGNGIVKITSALFKFGKTLVGGFIDKLANADFETAIEILHGLLSGGLAIGLGSLIFSLAGSVKKFGGILDSFSDIINNFKEKMSFGDGGDGIIANIKSLATSILILTASLLILSLIDSEKLSYGIAVITALFADLIGTMVGMSKLVGFKNKAMQLGIVMITMSVSILLLASALKKLGSLDQDTLTNGLLGVTGLLLALSVAINVLASSTRKLKKGTATTLIAISLALLLLVPTVQKLSEMSWEELGKAGAALGGLVGAFALLALASKMITPKKLTEIGGSLITISLALMLFIPSIRKLSEMSWEDLGKAGAAIYGLVGAFALLALASKLIKPAQLSKIGGSLIKISIALLLFTASITMLSEISWEGLGKAGAAIVGLVGAFALLALSTKLIKPAQLSKIGGALMVLSTAMLLFTASIAILSTISWEGLGKAGAAIAGLVGAFTLLALATKLITPTKLASIGAAVIVLASALLVLTVSIAVLSAISWEDLGKAGVAIYGLVGAFALLALATKTITVAKLTSLSVGMLALSKALLVMAVAFRVLGGLSWGGLAVSLVAIAGAITIFAVAALLCKPLVPVMVALSGAIMTFSLAMLALSGALLIAGLALPLLASGLVAFGSVLVMSCALIIEALGVILVGLVDICADLIVSLCNLIIKSAVPIGLAIAALIAMVCVAIYDSLPEISKLLIVLITEVCKILVECVPIIAEALLKLVIGVLDQLTKYVPTIIDFVFNLLLAVLSGIANNIPKLVKGIIDILAKLFDEVLNVLASVDPSVIIDGLLAVGLLAGIMAALSAVAGLIPGAMIGVIGMGLVATELAAVLAVIGQLTKIPGLMDAIGNGGEFLQAIGEAIGKFVGGIAGGIAEGFTDSLPAVGTNLSSFMTNAQGFFDGLKNIDESTLQSAMSLVKVILAITAANIIEGIASWITGESSITQFASDIVALGMGLKGFAVAVAGIDPEAVKAAASAAKTIAEMTDTIPNSGGVVSWFAGDNSITAFASEIPKLGAGLKGFADKVAGINPEQVTAAANAAKTLAEMTNTIPNSGGVVSWFAGDNSVANFASELGLLGSAIKGFADESTGVNPEQVTAAAKAAKTLAEMTNAIPNQGGVVAWFSGESSISKYANQLPALGRGLKGFANQVVDINAENVTSAAQAAQAIAEMTNHIPKEGGIKAWFTGESSVSKFADKLPELGKGIKGFSRSIFGIIPSNVEAAANAAKALAEMTDHIPKKLDKIGEFGNAINGFGSKLASYFGSLKNVTEGSINNSNKAVDAVKKFESLNADGISGSAKAIDSVTAALKNMASIPKDATSTFVTAIEKLGKASADSLLKSFEDLGSKLKKVATKAMGEFVSGLGDEGKKSSAKKVCTSMVTACADAMSEKKTSFYNAGSNLVSGFANGISENSYKAAAKAKAMAEAAVEAARKELDINSPSKVFRSMGYSIPEGLAMGIDKMGYMVTKSSESMADTAIDNVGWSISRLADVVNSDIDAQPTIRPVLDLSDVKAGASSIGKMLDGTSSVGVMANVGAISAMMDKQNQNGRNGDVVSAIKDLAKDIGNNRGDTYNFGNISYDDDSSLAAAVRELVRAARQERRV